MIINVAIVTSPKYIRANSIASTITFFFFLILVSID